MADSETFAGRLKTYIDEKKISIWDFERLSGLKKGIINNAIRGNAFIGSDKLALIITNFPDLNPVWLLIGKGDMILLEEKKAQNQYAHNNNGNVMQVMEGNIIYTEKEHQENLKEIERLRIEVQALRDALKYVKS